MYLYSWSKKNAMLIFMLEELRLLLIQLYYQYLGYAKWIFFIFCLFFFIILLDFYGFSSNFFPCLFLWWNEVRALNTLEIVNLMILKHNQYWWFDLLYIYNLHKYLYLMSEIREKKGLVKCLNRNFNFFFLNFLFNKFSQLDDIV